VSYNFFIVFTAPKESLHQRDKNKNTKDCRCSRKLLFEEYMCTEDVSAGLKRGELIQVNLIHAPKNNMLALINFFV